MNIEIKSFSGILAVIVFALMPWANAGETKVAEQPVSDAREKLLLGFEKKEFETRGMPIDEKDGVWTVTLNKLSPNVKNEFKWEPALVIAKGNATEGEFALKRAYSTVNQRGGSSYPWKPYVRDFRLVTELDVMPTWGVFERILPMDWSGYARLRFDLFAKGRPVTVRVSLEDRQIVPPVERCFSVPADTWVTLEFELDDAEKKAGLNLKEMANLFIIPEPADPFPSEILLDNIRLSATEAPSRYKIIRDPSAFEPPKPRRYSVNVFFTGDTKYPWVKTEEPLPEIKQRTPSAVKPAKVENATLDLTPFKMRVKGRLFISAADADHLLVGGHFTGKGSDSEGVGFDGPGACAAFQTADGGVTWKGLRKPERPSVLTTERGDGTAGTVEADVLVADDIGCSVGGRGRQGYPKDRFFFRRARFTGEGWVLTPHYLMDIDLRHCAHFPAGMRDSAGRLWMAWTTTEGRLVNQEVWAKYSTDYGTTWHPWHGVETKTARIPMLSSEHKIGEYIVNRDDPQYPFFLGVEMVSIQGQPAVFAGKWWSTFDGKEWSERREAPWPWRNQVLSVGDELFALKGSTLFRWNRDAKKPVKGCEDWEAVDGWKEVEKASSKGGRFSVCNSNLVYIVPGKGALSPNNLFCWRRSAGNWVGPEKLLEKDEEAPITEITVQPDAPAGFVPVAYAAKSGAEIRVLKVPATK